MHESRSEPVHGANLLVLVIGDEESVRNGLAKWLSQWNFTVLTASDLSAAIAAAVEHNPDVILLDVKLGVEDGLEFVHRNRGLAMETPIVVLTAHAGPYDGFKAHELGVADLIEKPSSPKVIAAALRSAVTGAIKRYPGHRKSGPHSSRIAPRSTCVKGVIWLVRRDFKTKGLSLNVIAKSVGLSPGHMGKLFRREMGYSIISFIHQCRVVHAAHLLTKTDLSIKAIAEECGYHGSSELDRHFTRAYDEAPVGFRRRNRQSAGNA